MLSHDRLLDTVENFILFDESKAGATRKVIARNHQALGVNQAVASISRQEELKREFPIQQRLRHRVIELPLLASRVPAVSALLGSDQISLTEVAYNKGKLSKKTCFQQA